MRRRDLATAIWALAIAWACGALAAPEIARPAADDDLPPAAAAPPLPALEEVAQQLATIEAELARLAPQAVLQPRLADYDRRLAAIKTRFRPDFVPAESNQLELHVVGVHEGVLAGPGRRVADVRVTYTAAPIILCLCSYNPVEWRLQVGDNVRLAQVILSGYEQQTLVGAPAGVPVANYSRPEMGEYLGRAFARDQVESDGGYTPFAAALLEKTGLSINTFQGAYSAPKDVLIVGPEGDAWRSERVRTEVAALFADVANERRRVLWPNLKDLRFSARLPSAGIHGGRPKSYGQFSLSGPLPNAHQQIPEKARFVSQMAVDPQGPVHYAFNGEGLVALDLATGKGRYVELDEDQEELHSVCGLTFDSRRRRVVLATNARPGQLYRYEPDARRWLPLKSLENVGLLSLAYLEAQDALFGLAFDGETLQLYRFDAEGKLESKLPVKGLPLKARGPFAEGVAQLQLVAADDRLVALVEYEALRRETGATLQAYLLDPVSAEVIFSSDLLPAPATQEQPKQVAVGKLAPTPPVTPRPSREDFELFLPPPAVHRFVNNDHYYELLELRRSVTWAEARDIAASRSYEGRPGYLATITSAEESEFINEHWKTARGAAWLGASDDEQEGEWKWVTGPEAGTVFWRGGSDGQAVGFHNWGRTQLLEPNNRMRDGLGENFCIWNWSFTQTGPFYWNDVRAEWTENRLLVEYSGPPRIEASPEKEAVVPPAEERARTAPPPPVIEQTAPVAPPDQKVFRNDANGHRYQYLTLERPVAWSEARELAAKQSHEGWQGYLATITTPEENAFVEQHLRGAGAVWLGASDEDQEGEWKWVTGPEAGDVFWRGDSSGQPAGFHNWDHALVPEPNNTNHDGDGRGEDYCLWNWSNATAGPYVWNDVPREWTANGLLVEYSAPLEKQVRVDPSSRHAAPSWRKRLKNALFAAASTLPRIAQRLRSLLTADENFNGVVYGFNRIDQARPTRGALAFVRQHRYFPPLNRVDFVLMGDQSASSPADDGTAPQLTTELVANYSIIRGRPGAAVELTSFPGSPGAVTVFAFGPSEFDNSVFHDLKDLRDDDWRQFLAGGWMVKRLSRPDLMLSWTELRAFLADSTVKSWSIAELERWHGAR